MHYTTFENREISILGRCPQPRMTNILETQRLLLRPLVLADAETAFRGWTGDPEVSKYVSWLSHRSIDDAIEWVQARVAASHAKENVASAKVLEKLGFAYEGDGVSFHIDGARSFQSRRYSLKLDSPAD